MAIYFYVNDHETLSRRLTDGLPYDARRAAYRLLHPRIARELGRMRRGEGMRSNKDLTTFLRKKAIFVHVPKAAGRSIKKVLFDGHAASHMAVNYYMVAFTRAEFESAFKFAFVRNPWDRLYSAYRFLMAGGLNGRDQRAAARHLAPHGDFEGFVMKGLGTFDLREVLHLIPQIQFLSFRPGIIPLDFIGYFERLDVDFPHVASRLGVAQQSMPWENKTKGKETPYTEAYTPEMIEKVGRIYADDIQTLGYSFDGLAPIALNQKPPLPRA